MCTRMAPICLLVIHCKQSINLQLLFCRSLKAGIGMADQHSWKRPSNRSVQTNPHTMIACCTHAHQKSPPPPTHTHTQSFKRFLWGGQGRLDYQMSRLSKTQKRWFRVPFHTKTDQHNEVLYHTSLKKHQVERTIFSKHQDPII